MSEETKTTKSPSRWKFYPWGRNAKAICERIESLITEIRLAEARTSDNLVTTTRLSSKALLAAIQQSGKNHG